MADAGAGLETQGRSEEPESTNAARASPHEQVMESLKKVAQVDHTEDPPPDEALKLFFTARRLAQEDRWGSIAAFPLSSTDLTWVIRAVHFSEDFADCSEEVVLPLRPDESITMARHEDLRRELRVKGLFYALLDADGSVVLYELQPAQLQSFPDQRPLHDPAYVEPKILASMAKEAFEEGGATKDAKKSKGRKRKKDETKT
ncbi:unnamed protein product [Symbiodinium natans]|uniref:tRNA-splicing endonuclease subunit Sen15 domain-containing protein n=1 Tax=Symbiodinium natans TaxID=878477 RepID=A0A812MMQ9_9DINO|nr:unnamed protein product [Symbiodinium natans]